MTAQEESNKKAADKAEADALARRQAEDGQITI